MLDFFKLKERNTTISREIIGGLSTFLAMVYVLALVPSLLSGTGQISFEAAFSGVAIATAVATFVMAFWANLPVALSSGIAPSVFLVYGVVVGLGVPWQSALAAVFIEGVVFILLSVFGIREAIIKALPKSLQNAIAVGIGLFITLIAFSNAGITTSAGGTIIGFASLSNPSVLLAVLGIIISVVLYVMRVSGAILLSIIVTTVLGVIFGEIALGDDFSAFSSPSAPMFLAMDFSVVFDKDFFMVFFALLFLDLFNTIGTLVGVANAANLLASNGKMPKIKQALLSDATGTCAGACLGAPTITCYVESGAGVAAGAKTGLASVVTALLFLLSLFLAPLFALIPHFALTGALVLVGYLMMKSVSKIDFSEISEGIPAFIAIIVMPFAYDIVAGMAWGVIAYAICKCASGKSQQISLATWLLTILFVAKIVYDAGAFS